MYLFNTKRLSQAMSGPLRVGIYARYSSDLQNPSSIEDQVKLCRKLIHQNFPNSVRVEVYKDAALSGANMLRPGLVRLLEDVADSQINLIVAEGLDRISRNLGDLAQIHDLCSNAQAQIWTSHEGAIGDLHIGFKGTMNALYLKDLKEKVRRAHQARASEGYAPAGLSYGYRVKRDGLGADGKFMNGLREIYPEQAAIVRRIFEAFAQGMPARSIVKTLNDEKIPAPAGGRWSVNSVLGAPSRGQGILNNELYRGVLVYNRTRKLRDRLTGRVRHAPNPESEWVRTQVPELRIIDDDLWNKAHANRRRFAVRTPKTRKKDRPFLENRAASAHALTGLVHCGACGGMKTLADRGRYICETFRLTRACKNARGTSEEAIGTWLEVELQRSLAAVHDLGAEVRELCKGEAEKALLMNKARADLQARKERLLDAIENGVTMKDVFLRIEKVDTEIRQLGEPVPLPPIDASGKQMKQDLSHALHVIFEHIADPSFAAPIRRALSKVISEIRLTPIAGQRSGENLSLEVRPGGWAALYCHIHDVWPGVQRPKSNVG